MIEAAVTWTDNERYVGAASSRHSVVMDTAAEKTASTPMELVLIALCGCTASDVVGILRKKRADPGSCQISREKSRTHRAVPETCPGFERVERLRFRNDPRRFPEQHRSPGVVERIQHAG